ncbi:MAG: GNAT family N-acetyltransferase [Chitinophagaceae bacterium]
MNILQTKRLDIAQLTIEHAPFILELTNSPDWLQYIGDRGIKTITDAQNYIINGPMASYAMYGHGLYLMTLTDTTVPIGICGIIKRDTLEDKDIGFALLPQYTGNGYAFEAAAAILIRTKEILHIPRIVAITLPINAPSIKLLTRLGMVFEKMVSFPPKDEALMLFATQ